VDHTPDNHQCAGFAAVSEQTLQPYTSMTVSITNRMSTPQRVRVQVTDLAQLAGDEIANLTFEAAIDVDAGASISEKLKWPGSSCGGDDPCTNFAPKADTIQCIADTGAVFDPMRLRTIGLYVGDASSTDPINNLNLQITAITFE
jgi:hypothetical protein